jgi:ribosomal-protein-alanine N-acetyltransferase
MMQNSEEYADYENVLQHLEELYLLTEAPDTYFAELPKPQIVRADSHNLPQILQIERDSFPDPWTEEMFYFYLGNEHGELLLAVIESETAHTYELEEPSEPIIVGYLAATVIPPECNIDNIATAPAFRRKGVASALLEVAFGLGETLYLEVREKNIAARNFYAKFGFLEIALRKNYYDSPPDNAILLAKR